MAARLSVGVFRTECRMDVDNKTECFVAVTDHVWTVEERLSASL